jgi:type II secretory pathway pseudopilin PulG
LLELLVATACAGMVATAVLSLLVGAADTNRREWRAQGARRIAGGAVAAMAMDLARAGAGLENADAVQIGGSRIDYAASPSPGSLRLVLAQGPAAEITHWEPGSRYTVVGVSILDIGDRVAALGFEQRPAGAPLPIGTVAALTPRSGGFEVQVAWYAAEATLVEGWGEPRALLPVSIREYEVRPRGGALELVRSDDGGSRQPVADGLEGIDVVWLIDGDGDGHPDGEQVGAWPGPASRRCAARIEASVSVEDAGATTPIARALGRQSATRWVTLRC